MKKYLYFCKYPHFLAKQFRISRRTHPCQKPARSVHTFRNKQQSTDLWHRQTDTGTYLVPRQHNVAWVKPIISMLNDESNCDPCVAAMRLFVILLWPRVSILLCINVFITIIDVPQYCTYHKEKILHVDAGRLTVVIIMSSLKTFSERVVKVSNSLRPSIVSFSSLTTFRISLNKISFRIYAKY